jgi:hypothetical protein
LEKKDVKDINIKSHWSEFAVVNVYNQIKTDKDLLMYLPNKQMDRENYPNREWFWGVVSTVLPDWALAYR